MKVTDDDGGSDNATTMIVVYDPEGPWNNSDGSLDSPTGLLTTDPGASGEFWFHLTGRYYHPTDTVPVGTAKAWLAGNDFRFDAGSTGIEWLVATPDGKIAAKGTGTLQGKTGRYGFVFYGYDGCDDGANGPCQPGKDRFRVVIWDTATGPIPSANSMYDNTPTAGYDLDEAEPDTVRSGIVTIQYPTG